MHWSYMRCFNVCSVNRDKIARRLPAANDVPSSAPPAHVPISTSWATVQSRVLPATVFLCAISYYAFQCSTSYCAYQYITLFHTYWDFRIESIAWKTHTEIFSSNHNRESSSSHMGKAILSNQKSAVRMNQSVCKRVHIVFGTSSIFIHRSL